MSAAANNARVAALRAQRQQRIVDRQQKLAELWREELQHDYNLLHKPWDPPAAGSAVDINSPFNLQPWFKTRGFDNTPQFITEEISKYVKSRLPQNKAATLLGFMANDDWFDRNKNFLGFGHDIRPGNPSEGVGLVRSLLKSNVGGNPQLWAPVKALLELLDRLRVMRRFADGRNPELTAAPLPDGSNIPRQHHALIAAWTLHRAWIRALHYRTLKIGNHQLGFDHIQDILQLSLGLYALELEDVPFSPQSGQVNLARTKAFRTMYDKIQSALRDLGRYLGTETRRRGQYGMSATMRYNLNPDRFGAAIQQVISTLDPSWELWGAILGKAAALEKASDVLHVENVMIEKRVVVQDEYFDLLGDMLDRNYDPRTLNHAAIQGSLGNNEEQILKYLQKVSETNRLRRNKLLLTEWNESGPWKQLYIMYDTSATGKPGFVKLISDFWSRKDMLESHFLREGPPGPSNPGNVWSKLFPIHPIASTNLPDKKRLGQYQGTCLVCFEEFVDTCESVLVRLKCDHWYHFICIRGMWDHPDSYSFPCPQCRLDPHNWRLHEHAGITPEVRALDVWDFEAVTDPGHVFGIPPYTDHPPMPNLTDHYYHIDTAQYNMARNFVQGSGYKSGAPGLNREPEVEMAVLRKKRRDRNKRRKDLLTAARRGFAGLDPVDEDAING